MEQKKQKEGVQFLNLFIPVCVCWITSLFFVVYPPARSDVSRACKSLQPSNVVALCYRVCFGFPEKPAPLNISRARVKLISWG
jgi:hypothetical protein